MLYINEMHNGTSSQSTWHIGEPMPYISPASRVITFQADGNELDVILEAIRSAALKKA